MVAQAVCRSDYSPVETFSLFQQFIVPVDDTDGKGNALVLYFCTVYICAYVCA